MAERIDRTAAPSPEKIASPIRKWPILSSAISLKLRDLFRGDEIEAVAGMDFEARAFRQRDAA